MQQLISTKYKISEERGERDVKELLMVSLSEKTTPFI